MSGKAPDRLQPTDPSAHHSRSSKVIPIPTTDHNTATLSERELGENYLAVGDRPHHTARPRTTSSGSYNLGRTPTRSFYHRSFHGQLQPAQYSSDGLREQTAELAAFAFSDGAPSIEDLVRASSPKFDGVKHSEVIKEVSEPTTPVDDPNTSVGESSTARVDKKMSQYARGSSAGNSLHKALSALDRSGEHPESEPNEYTALLDQKRSVGYLGQQDVEGQKTKDVEGQKTKDIHSGHSRHVVIEKIRSCTYLVSHPKTWSARIVWNECIVRPTSLLPAVFLGLLLNILDALSYGMILFPLGNKIFEDLGPDGISMFYVSTIIAQVVYSAGGSTFRGGIGSEMIEVVPFFHHMATTILDEVGEENPKAVLATTILAFAISSVITGLVFFLMGTCKLGSLIGFFPRHILIGCIGGVGWFLVATGIEVSARLHGSLQYNLDTLRQLFHGDQILLWTIPLLLALCLLLIQRFYKSDFLVGGYFIMIAALFYVFKTIFKIPMAALHDKGWVFDSPPAGKSWYHFYTLYDFDEVRWDALAQAVPGMFALTFFGILHVPINVPALGISTGEDNLNLDRELIAHGISNCVSGLCGSIQNYLVYTNSLLFIASGGNDRLAGLLLAAATFGILLAGPVIIGYIPVMVVGALIFLLGIELLEEAIFDTFGKLHRLEYITVLVIIVTMGVYDFVAGILVGIVLAALNFVVQTSRRTAIRATYSGQIAHSTVRRPPVQLKFLDEAGQQIFILKLAGFLFFGTIVGVENRIRALLDEDAFDARPLRFLVLDMRQIHGIDFSAAEAFSRINRLLQKKGVQLVISGLELESEVGRALEAVGLLSEEGEVKVFESLNQALENCENKLLAALYRQQESRRFRTTSRVEIPQRGGTDLSSSYQAEFLVSSPRRYQLHQAATATLEDETMARQKWQSFKQPLPLLLQIFEDESDRHEDFWHRATSYFERVAYPSGSIIFQVGDRPNAFYMLEVGIMRAEYDLPQGSYAEVIVAGRPCGELPFFSNTPRTAKMTAEKDCVVWQLNGPQWKELQSKDPEVAQELLRMSLKLTKERMDVITSYVLTTAG